MLYFLHYNNPFVEPKSQVFFSAIENDLKIFFDKNNWFFITDYCTNHYNFLLLCYNVNQYLFKSALQKGKF